MNATVDYSRLSPRERTPGDEICSCDDSGPIKLTGGGGLLDNPISCVRCNGEVPPERLGLDQRAVEVVADWVSEYGAIDRLELASGAYELWAQGELTNPRSPINEAAYETRAVLDEFRRCYFSFWQPAESSPDACPLCGESLTAIEPSWPAQVACEKDSIIMFTGSGEAA